MDFWIESEKIKNEKGNPIEFNNHTFLKAIARDESQEQVVIKGSQIGMSTLNILRLLHAAKFLGINQIYTLPTVDDVRAFVPGKVNQIIDINPTIRAEFSRKDKDAVEQKQIGKSFIYFKGTYTEREAIMLSSDKNYYDEIDKSKPEVIRTYASRLGFSKIRAQYYFSTPTIPDFGIDKLWGESDQKHWRFNCPKCGYRQHMEWEKNVDMDFRKYVCQKCHQELSVETIKGGSWEARYPERDVSGYWIPQMIATWRTANDLIKELEDSEDEQYFYNFILGIAYLSQEAKIPSGLINKNLISTKNSEKDAVMGVDVHKRNLHVIIGNEEGVFHIAMLEDQPGKNKWKRLGELMEVYEIRYCVIDGGYDTNRAFEFARKFQDKVYVNFYKDDPKKTRIVRFSDESFVGKMTSTDEDIKVLTDRNRMIDVVVAELRRSQIKFNFLAGDIRVKELISHLQTMYVRIVTDKVGREHREWVSTTGGDHFLHCLVYWKIALQKKLGEEC